jgi:uncharacterized metal-binding protein
MKERVQKRLKDKSANQLLFSCLAAASYGKSYLLAEIRTCLARNSFNFAVCAVSGIAATNLP